MTYERATYAPKHMQLYLRMRNEAIESAIAQRFQRPGRLRILEVGCGTGLTLSFVAAASEPRSVIAMDIEPQMLREAQQKVRTLRNPVRLIRASAPILPFQTGAFDVVYATRFIHQFRDKAAAYAEMLRVTAPDGVIMVEFYRRPYHFVRFYTHRMRDDRAEFLTHSPSLAEVRSVVGEKAEYVPLRLAGSRLLCAALGPRITEWLVRRSWRSPLHVLVDEYLTIVDRLYAVSPVAVPQAETSADSATRLNDGRTVAL